jgi:hypothetical protein
MSEKEEKKEEIEEEEEKDTNYKVPKKVDLKDIAKMDEEDESLKRYKEQLLGKALSGEGLGILINNKRC